MSEFQLAADCDVDEDVEVAPPPDPPAQARPATAKSKAKAQAKAASRHKASANSKSFRVYYACQVRKPESELALNQKVDLECKHFLDSIYKQAKAQGAQALQWFSETRADPTKCKSMVDSYRTAYKNWCAGGKVGKVKWSIIQCKESVEATSGTRLAENQQLMWERQALLFWQSVDGGANSEEESQQKWNALAARVGEPGVIYDKKGPERKPLRLAITREDMVINCNDVARKRQMEWTEKVKNDDASVAKSMKRHDKSRHDRRFLLSHERHHPRT